MSEPQSLTIIESLLAQQKAAFGPGSLDAAVKRMESAANLTGICMHMASDIWCCELEMMTKSSRQLAAVTESLLGETDIEQPTGRPAETVKLAVEEAIQDMRRLNDMVRANSFEIYDAFVRTLIPTAAPKETPKASSRPAGRLTAAA